MTDIIQADHDLLEKIAGQFRNESEAVAEMLQAVQHGMQRLRNDWLGRGSEAFFSEMEKEILPAVRRLIDALALAGETTNQINGLLQQADESYSITLAAYQEGATELLPLLEAQRTRAEIRQQYYRTLFDYQTSILLLEQATGSEVK